MLNALIRDEQLGESLDKAFLEHKSLLCQAHSTGEFKQRHLLKRRRRRRCSTRDGNPCDDSWSGSTARGKSEVAAQVKAQKRREAGGTGADKNARRA